jgi:hypothetical protein
VSATDVVTQNEPEKVDDALAAKHVAERDAAAKDVAVDDAAPDTAEQRGTRPSRARTPAKVLLFLAPGLLFLAVRGIGLAVLKLMAWKAHVSAAAVLTAWDGQWYLGLAAGGYDRVPAKLSDAHGMRLPETPLAFFPGYPFLVHWLGELPGVTLVGAALLVSVVSGVAAAYGLMRIAKLIPRGNTKTGLALVALFAASPMAVVLSMAYSEALFTALAIWSLVFVLEKRWLLAGLLCTLAGLVRPTASALVLAVGLAALVCVIKNWRAWRAWLGGLIAPLGLLGYLGWVAHRTGTLDGYFALQTRGWDSEFDFGAATWKFLQDTVTSVRQPLEVLTVGIVLGAVVLCVLCFTQRVPWPLLVFTIGVLVMDLGTNGLMSSKARLLVPAFVLLLPMAVGLSKRKPATLVWCLLGAAVVSGWYGAYALVAWPYAI